MIDPTLASLAKAAGILVHWKDAFGNPQATNPESLRAVLTALGLPVATDQQVRESRASLKDSAKATALPALVTAVAGDAVVLPSGAATPARYRIDCEDGQRIDGTAPVVAGGKVALPPVAASGYHRLVLDQGTTTLAVAPHRCFGIADSPGRARTWGATAQLYALRQAGDGGIGSYGALAVLAHELAKEGADALAVSPVHAMFASDPTRYSPYAPSSRLFLNVLHVDVIELCKLAGVDPDAESAARMQHGEALELIDWPGVSATRLALMRHAFDALTARGQLYLDAPLGRDFAAFRRVQGVALERHALFEALQARVLREDKSRFHWRAWPEGFRDPSSDAVAAFARDSNDDVAFHAFLQWRAALGLARAQAAAVDGGMRFGLIADLAVGTDSAGSHAWGHQRAMLSTLSVGAPPDLFNPLGQDWGLTTFSPHALQQTGYAPFLDLLRAVLRHAGGVRIDHVLGLKRLWMVPHGASARDGVYLTYPLHDLLRLVALESWRHKALVIGEDLGTVPHGFRSTLRDAGILGTRVLWFERRSAGFVPAPRWPAETMATSSTHDLPTIAGWWAGRDIEWRDRLGLLGADDTATGLQEDRQADRKALWSTLCKAGVAQGEPPTRDAPEDVLRAIAAFVGSTPCTLALLPLEDILGLIEQPNLPGTIESHPNWRRRLPLPVDRLMQDPAVRLRLDALSSSRRAP